MARIVNLNMQWQDLERRLRNKEWTKGGRGAFGFVMLKGALCWKIERGCGNSGWAKYICAVAKGELSGPHVPRVRLVVVFPDGTHACLMERLKATLRHHAETEKHHEQKLLTEGIVSATLRRSSRNVKSYVSQRDPWIDESRGHKPQVPVVTIVKTLRRVNITASFLRLSKQLHAWARDHDCWLDTHGLNIMVRNDGTLVITDPVT